MAFMQFLAILPKFSPPHTDPIWETLVSVIENADRKEEKFAEVTSDVSKSKSGNVGDILGSLKPFS